MGSGSCSNWHLTFKELALPNGDEHVRRHNKVASGPVDTL